MNNYLEHELNRQFAQYEYAESLCEKAYLINGMHEAINELPASDRTTMHAIRVNELEYELFTATDDEWTEALSTGCCNFPIIAKNWLGESRKYSPTIEEAVMLLRWHPDNAKQYIANITLLEQGEHAVRILLETITAIRQAFDTTCLPC